MPKKFFKQYTPDPKRIRDTPGLGFLGARLQQPNLWHFNRHSIAKAVAIGLFCTWLPFPFQTVFAAVTALFVRANIAISVALVFITNPITSPPLFYFAYQLGNLVLGRESMDLSIDLTMDWLTDSLSQIWQPLFLGSFLLGVFCSMLGYLSIQMLWRYNIRQRLKTRASKRQAIRAE